MPGHKEASSFQEGLARAMGGQVDVVNREPGAEFRLNFESSDNDRA